MSFPAIEARLGTPFPLGTDTYLAHYVVAQLERKMLGELAGAGLAGCPVLNINLPLSYAATTGFTAIRQAARHAGTSLGVEVALTDAMADLGLFFAVAGPVAGG